MNINNAFFIVKELTISFPQIRFHVGKNGEQRRTLGNREVRGKAEVRGMTEETNGCDPGWLCAGLQTACFLSRTFPGKHSVAKLESESVLTRGITVVMH